MPLQQIQDGDFGTRFTVTIEDPPGTPKDIQAATTKEIIFRSPDRPVGTQARTAQSADFVTDGSDGQIEYITQDGDIDEVGEWHIQGHVILPTGDFESSIDHFKVNANL